MNTTTLGAARPVQPLLESTSGLIGVPMLALRRNGAASQPWLADRAGMILTYRLPQFAASQPNDFYVFETTDTPVRNMLRWALPLDSGETLVALDDYVHDFGSGVAMVRVRRMRDGTVGFITIYTLVTQTSGPDSELWCADDIPALRARVDFDTEFGPVYSTNRMDQPEIEQTTEFLSQFLQPEFDVEAAAPHPLAAGAHGNRFGSWALDAARTAKERKPPARQPGRTGSHLPCRGAPRSCPHGIAAIVMPL
jgi:hypothetical protein